MDKPTQKEETTLACILCGDTHRKLTKPQVCIAKHVCKKARKKYLYKHLSNKDKLEAR